MRTNHPITFGRNNDSGLYRSPSFTYDAIIHERGNGFPQVGEYVTGQDGKPYRIVRLIGPVLTGQRSGLPNRQYAILEGAGWDNITEEAEPYASAVILPDDAEVEQMLDNLRDLDEKLYDTILEEHTP